MALAASAISGLFSIGAHANKLENKAMALMIKVLNHNQKSNKEDSEENEEKEYRDAFFNYDNIAKLSTTFQLKTFILGLLMLMVARGYLATP